MVDPFLGAYEEVVDAVGLARKRVGVDSADELSREVADFHHDIQDLQDAVNVSQKNPERYGLTAKIIEERNNMLDELRSWVQTIEERLNTYKKSTLTTFDSKPKSTPNSARPPTLQPSGAIPHLQQTNEASTQLKIHATFEIEHDQQLEALTKSTNQLHRSALVISEELREQHQLLENLDETVDADAQNMGLVMQRMAIVVGSSNRKQLTLIFWLVVFAMGMLLLILLV